MLEFETVSEMLEYREGEVYWKHRPLKYFAGEQWYTSWNKKYSGTRAGALRLDDWSGESYRWIKVDSVTRSLGCNKSLFEAACLRKAAELKYDFHANHGLRHE
jgi:hypothetical protein